MQKVKKKGIAKGPYRNGIKKSHIAKNPKGNFGTSEKFLRKCDNVIIQDTEAIDINKSKETSDVEQNTGQLFRVLVFLHRKSDFFLRR